MANPTGYDAPDSVGPDSVGPGSVGVADNLAHAAERQGLSEQDVRDGSGLTNEVHQPGGAEHVADPVDAVLGLNSTGWVAVAALVVLLIMLVKKVPAIIGGSLDARIAAIRTQLDEAKRLRAEAEALRAEYQAKAGAADADAATMRAHAHQEAAVILAKAKLDAEELMARRARMAEDKIAAAERAAIAEVRARAADAATRAAGLLIAERHDEAADRARVDRTIAGLGRLN